MLGLSDAVPAQVEMTPVTGMAVIAGGGGGLGFTVIVNVAGVHPSPKVAKPLI